ncbi:MAG: hypothetical protein AB7W59_14160 [Acidimicrobiia bacterium]
MNIEHSNGTIPQPVTETNHSISLPEFDPPVYRGRTLTDLRAERQRINRRFGLAAAVLLAIAVGYFVAAAFAPTVALADIAADVLAAVIYLCGGFSMGYLAAQAGKSLRGRRQ